MAPPPTRGTAGFPLNSKILFCAGRCFMCASAGKHAYLCTTRRAFMRIYMRASSHVRTSALAAYVCETQRDLRKEQGRSRRREREYGGQKGAFVSSIAHRCGPY